VSRPSLRPAESTPSLRPAESRPGALTADGGHGSFALAPERRLRRLLARARPLEPRGVVAERPREPSPCSAPWARMSPWSLLSFANAPVGNRRYGTWRDGHADRGFGSDCAIDADPRSLVTPFTRIVEQNATIRHPQARLLGPDRPPHPGRHSSAHHLVQFSRGSTTTRRLGSSPIDCVPTPS
jgi:hypothetical protein